MARGLPAVWGSIFGGPMIASGIYFYWFAATYPLVPSQPETPPSVGLITMGFGLFITGMGVYVHSVAAPEALQLRDGEHIVEDRKPAQRNALAEAGIAVPILGLGGYLLYVTQRPLYQPTLVLAGGLFLFSRGLYRYWQNTLTTYFLTNQRVVEEYRFVSLLRNEVPLQKVRGVEEYRSVWDSLFGLGNVAVRSGASGGLTISINQVYEPAEFGDLVRSELTPERDEDVPFQEGQTATTGATSGKSDSPTVADADDTTDDGSDAASQSDSGASPQ
ncbi:PH domain-containing protein [Haloarcula sp. CBA1127]|uniref:PH domain-containing protein n=1 Tax=Haloarcula sp. CBA1127 TaxID=1765055 RepID=UPI0009AD215D|nr:PH domain-containing protein [Haloarcula sp. CBA1127]